MDHDLGGGRRYSRSTKLIVAILVPVLTACIPADTTDGDDAVPPIVAEAGAVAEATTTTTTSSPTTTTETPGPTTTAAAVEAADSADGPETSGAEFVAMFDNDSGLEEFNTFVFHRDGGSGEWIGDHDRSCGPPDPGREIVVPELPPGVSETTEEIYLCRDHLMTSMETVASYSIVGFAPDQVFERSESTVVSWDVNVTDLGDRQWWEVIVIPADTSHVVCHPHIIDPCGADIVDEYVSGTAMFGIGPYAEFQLVGDQIERQPGDKPCGPFGPDPEGCDSKATRRRFTMTDNRDGTITVDYPEADRTWTISGTFPERFEVVFKDHNYTPEKDNDPPGFTWHWDNIIVR